MVERSSPKSNQLVDLNNLLKFHPINAISIRLDLQDVQGRLMRHSITAADEKVCRRLYALASGYAIARRLGRTFYYPALGRDKFLCYLELVSHVFPRTTSVYKVIPIDNIELTIVPFAVDEHGKRTCCRYDDPARFMDHPAKFLLLNHSFAQNANYMESYIDEIRQLFLFSEEIHTQMKRTLRQLNLGSASDFMCVHIRRSDYLSYGLKSDLPSTLHATKDIAAKKNLTNYLVFGDDKKFMAELAYLLLSSSNSSQKIVRSSTFSEITDFYVAHRFCKAFYMRVPTSTFAWWLAFFSRDQDSVFYYQSHIVDHEDLKPDFHFEIGYKTFKTKSKHLQIETFLPYLIDMRLDYSYHFCCINGLSIFVSAVILYSLVLNQFCIFASSRGKSNMPEVASFVNSSIPVKYLALKPIRHRLGNQLFHFASGYGIARKLRRKLYYAMPGDNNRTLYYLDKITEIFPKTKVAFEILPREQINPVSVRFYNGTKWLVICCGFFDTSKNNKTGTMCVHIRRNDFFRLGLESDLFGTLQATKSIAADKGLRQYLIFGDDKDFMSSLADELIKNSSETPVKVVISTFSEFTDLYIASRVCDAFLLSAVGSTFGWWLAFLTKNQNAVYIYKTGRKNEEFRFNEDDFLLKTWHIYNGAPYNYSSLAIAGILIMACTLVVVACRFVSYIKNGSVPLFLRVC
ncbi:unnamed protein product [Cylicocyclus nassatus]|uniref:L-Fucosyltransferase n=1 Tax=Cylicocyclus nassatus TaxID=53992 RepID=A0AA36GKH8_CYLNA|nr:unnamed protein product [Cylicocyclus nassatus]